MEKDKKKRIEAERAQFVDGSSVTAANRVHWKRQFSQPDSSAGIKDENLMMMPVITYTYTCSCYTDL